MIEYRTYPLVKKNINNTVQERPFVESFKIISKQECIPVGCVPSAAVVVSGGGGRCLPRGCLPRGCLPRGAGVCRVGGCLPTGGVCLGRVSGKHLLCEQNRIQVYKHYLAATMLRTVIDRKHLLLNIFLSEINFKHH